MDLLRLESRLDDIVAYLARLKAAMTHVDAELWPQAEISQDLESLMTLLNQIPSRVQEWKKSSARCGADVACRWFECTARRLKKRTWWLSRLRIPRSTPSSLS